MVLTADSTLARSTRRRQTSTGWNTAYTGANRYTLPLDEKPPADDALHPMAFLVEKGPGAVTRPHFHQADQFHAGAPSRSRRRCLLSSMPAADRSTPMPYIRAQSPRVSKAGPRERCPSHWCAWPRSEAR